MKNSTRFTLLAVLLLAAAPAFSQIIFQDGFESGTFKPEWVPKPGTPSGLVAVDDILGCVSFNHTGNFGAGLATSQPVSGTTTINALWLRLDLAQYQGKDVMLSFWMKDAGDFTNTEDAIYFSQDGGLTFPASFPLRPSQYTDDWGRFPPINIGQVSGLQLTSNFVISFSQRGSNDFNCTGGTQGYVIDDVEVQASLVQYATLPFFDGFEGTGLSNYWSSANPFYEGYTIYQNSNPEWKSRPDGVVEAVSSFNGVNFDAISGTKVLALGKRFDSSDNSHYVATAADLHLNLQGQTKVELTYWLKDLDSYSNVNLREIGIFLSDNGGLTFTPHPVFDWRFNEWTDDLWGRLPPLPLDKLADTYGKSLTSKFVVRFQAIFNRDFNPSGGRQGVLIDNVEVRVPSDEYATLPYCEDFETGAEVLNRYWHYSDPYLCGQTISDVSWVRPEGLVDVTSNANGVTFQAHSGTKVLAMGGRTVLSLANFASNAVDFHVKLAGLTGVKFTFWMRDFADTNNDGEAVYFSNNGGQTFQKAYPLSPSSISDTWHQYTLDVNQICSTFSPIMPLTDQFVIRIQQQGKGNFASGAGGFIIDDACVSITSANHERPGTLAAMLSPNPTAADLDIQLPDNLESGAEIHLFDTQGQSVSSPIRAADGGGQQTIRTTHLPAGIYLLRLTSGGQVWAGRFVKI